MIRKIMTACLSLILFAAAMPAQVRAEETGEEAETFESYYIIDEYTLVVTCYANGGKFDANEDGVSKDRKKKVCDLDIIIYEDDEDDENPKHLYTAEIGNLADGLSRKNCKFDGWYLDKGLTEKLEEKSTDGYGEFDKLYAKWIVVKGWEKTKEGWIYHLDENDYYTDGIYTIDGKKYGFDMNGYMVISSHPPASWRQAGKRSAASGTGSMQTASWQPDGRRSPASGITLLPAGLWSPAGRRSPANGIISCPRAQ